MNNSGLSIYYSYGYGAGTTMRAGPARLTIQYTDINTVYINIIDGPSDPVASSGFEAMVEIFGNVKMGFGVGYTGPDAEREYFLGFKAGPLQIARTNKDTSNDFIFSLGASAYAALGGGAGFKFNISEFIRQLSGDNTEFMNTSAQRCSI